MCMTVFFLIAFSLSLSLLLVSPLFSSLVVFLTCPLGLLFMLFFLFSISTYVLSLLSRGSYACSCWFQSLSECQAACQHAFIPLFIQFSCRPGLAWQGLRKSINGYINKVNVPNIQSIVVELFGINLVRGRGLFARSIIKVRKPEENTAREG